MIIDNTCINKFKKLFHFIIEIIGIIYIITEIIKFLKKIKLKQLLINIKQKLIKTVLLKTK